MKRDQIRSGRQHLGGLDVPGEPEPLHDHQHPPAWIGLARTDPEPRRTWERMMIVVPRLAHGDEAAVANVVTLDARPGDVPRARPAVVREISDEPVAGHGHGD